MRRPRRQGPCVVPRVGPRLRHLVRLSYESDERVAKPLDCILDGSHELLPPRRRELRGGPQRRDARASLDCRANGPPTAAHLEHARIALSRLAMAGFLGAVARTALRGLREAGIRQHTTRVLVGAMVTGAILTVDHRTGKSLAHRKEPG